MNPADLIPLISKPDFDIDALARLSIDEPAVRDEIVHQMLTHPHIMVYFHCGEVIVKASHERPDLFYPFWKEIVTLLSHSNSYHRDFGLTILANLTPVDRENRFNDIFEDYFLHLNDKKYLTAIYCVRGSKKIIRHKPALRTRIIEYLLDIDQRCVYPEKQKALLKCEILEIIDEITPQAEQKTDLEGFIKAQVTSLSPKTRKKAKELIKKYSL